MPKYLDKMGLGGDVHDQNILELQEDSIWKGQLGVSWGSAIEVESMAEE